MKDTCNVTNRSTGNVVYKIQDPDLVRRRVFAPGETVKNIPVVELERLMQIPGGRELFLDYLAVDDIEVLASLTNQEIPLEYWFTMDKLPGWMENCSLDEFKDALDFAPDGVKDLIKTFSVSLPLNDYSKREAIKNQLGFDVSAAIKNNQPDEGETKSTPQTTTRRVQPAQTTNRRVVQPTTK